MATSEAYEALHHDGHSLESCWVLVIRDPFNLLASRHRHAIAGSSERGGLVALEMWKQHAQEALGDTNYLVSKGGEGPSRLVVIKYNDWVESRCYRKQVAEQLGLQFCSTADREAVGYVPLYGRGSSFDGLLRQGQGHTMDVTKRIHSIIDCQLGGHSSVSKVTYRELFSSDSDLLRLANTLFGSLAIDFTAGAYSAGPDGGQRKPLSEQNWPCFSYPFGEQLRMSSNKQQQQSDE